MNDTPTPRTDEWLEEEKRNPRISGLGNWLDYCKTLERELTAVTEQRDRLTEALERIAKNNIQDTQQTDYAYELGRMEGIAKVALQSLNPDHFPDVGNMIGNKTSN